MFVDFNIGSLPTGVELVVANSHCSGGALSKSYIEICKKYSEKRQREFITGRVCAHKALTNFNIETVSIPVGEDRGPIWPNGIVGSITHCDGFYAAAVALKENYNGLGIDAEKNKAFPKEIEPYIFTENENKFFFDYSCNDNIKMLFFSSKESIYKCIYPIIKRYVDFHEVEISIDFTCNSLSARFVGSLSENLSLKNIRGSYLMGCDYVFTAFFLETEEA